MYRDPDRYAVTRGGGCLALFGLPFLLAGLGVIVLGVMGSVKSGPSGSAPLFVIIPFGLVFASVGAGLMFGRAGTVIDSRTRTISTWWGLLVPLRSTSVPIDDVTKVTVSREVRSSGKSSHTVYPVRLAREGEPLDIEEPREYAKARRRAEEVARFLDLGIEDSSSGKTVVREAGTLDMSLRDRARASGEKLGRPTAPPECRIVTSAAGSQATFDLPPPGLGAVGGFAVVAGLVFAAIPLVFMGGVFSSTDILRDMGKTWPFLAFMGIFTLVWLGGTLGFVLRAVKKATARGRLVVDPRELRLETRSFLGTKAVAIPSDEIEELDLVGGEGARLPQSVRAFAGVGECIVARSDRIAVEFGLGLSREELEWLRDTVRFIVTS